MNWIDDLVPEYGTVTGQFVMVSHDSADEDLAPDVQPLNGTVLLTPTVTAGRIDDTIFAQIANVEARIFGGQIVDDEDAPGIRILSTDTNIVDADWAWRATFQIDTGIRLRPLDFKLEAGNTVHLTGQTLPIDHTPHQIIQGEQGASITGVDQIAPDAMRVVIEDPATGEQKSSTILLPEGPRGPEGPYGGTEVTDPQVASYITDSTTGTASALNSRYVSMPVMSGPGIDPTGQTDSTAGMQAVIDAHPNGTISVPEGVYQFSALLCGQGQSLVGTGRSTYRDRYSKFGTPGWLDDRNFGGAVLRSTLTTGEAIVLDDIGEVTEGGLENLTLIGPGIGDATGVRAGRGTGPARSVVNLMIRNVMVGNFGTGVTLNYLNEGVLDALLIRGCGLGLDLAHAVRHNTFTGLDLQWCGRAMSISATCFSNGFYSPIMQSNVGEAAVIHGYKQAFYSPYLENNGDGFVFEATSAGNLVDTPFANSPANRIWFKVGSKENAVTNVGGAGLTSAIVNEGERNYFQGRMPGLVDTGKWSVVVDGGLRGTPYATWKTYEPTLTGGGWGLGNGVAEGGYTRIGQTVHVRVFMLFGSTTTFGTQSATISLPLPALWRAAGQVVMVKNLVGSFAFIAQAGTPGASSMSVRVPGVAGQTAPLTASHPVTWAAGDTLELYVTYETSAT